MWEEWSEVLWIHNQRLEKEAFGQLARLADRLLSLGVIFSVVDTYASLRHPDAYENNS